MAKLSEIREFLGGSMEVDIGKEQTLTIYPLKVGEMTSMYPSDFEKLSNEEKTKLSYKLILKSLNDPDVSEKDIENFPASLFTKLMEAINSLNGFDEKNEHIGAIKEKIARAREEK